MVTRFGMSETLGQAVLERHTASYLGENLLAARDTVLLPARVAFTMRRLPLTQFAVIGAVLVAGWFVLDAINHPRETTGQYLRGEADLRKLIE